MTFVDMINLTILHMHGHFGQTKRKCKMNGLLEPTHTYWCRLPANDSYQQGPLLGVF